MTDWTLDFGRRTTADQVLEGIDLGEQTALITGANVGIGFETARALAAAGARVILACREPAKGEQAAAKIRQRHPKARLEVQQLDLASLASVREFARNLPPDPIDMLICNAGRFGGGYQETKEGFELTVGVCHIGHFLLVQLLLDRLRAGAGARVVMVSSESHRSPKQLDFAKLPLRRESYSDLVAYGQAKLCNVLMAKAVQAQYHDQGVFACSLHPGTLVPTSIGRYSLLAKAVMLLSRPFTKTLAQGAATSVLCAAHPSVADFGGAYFSDCRPVRSSRESNDPAVADKLWALSEQWVKAAG